jgi:T3SS negative regulator,GrlR
MQNGIYHVNFSSSQNSAGTGIVVIKDGSVNGGDDGYLYTGLLLADGNQVSGQLQIKRWNASATSVFGPLDNFGLNLVGTSDDLAGTFTVSGGIAGQYGATISIHGRKLAPAA